MDGIVRRETEIVSSGIDCLVASDHSLLARLVEKVNKSLTVAILESAFIAQHLGVDALPSARSHESQQALEEIHHFLSLHSSLDRTVMR